MKKKFRSNGKLLLTGEYFVLDGATTLALPTIKGQTIEIHPWDNLNELKWKSFDQKNKIWFEADFSFNFDFTISSDDSIANRLCKLLKACQELNPNFNPFGNHVQTYLEFPLNWGLGSSSTLINNLAQWAAVDPFELLQRSFGGSGYDIACASNKQPILYTIKQKIPEVKKIAFNLPFKNQLYFVYLNQKQNTQKGIHYYRSLSLSKSLIIKDLNKITHAIVKAKTLACFEDLINKHEEIISKNLKIDSVKLNLFPDYRGVIKSLGAWGGDFILITYRKGMEHYFQSKGYKIILPYDQIILSDD